MGGIETNKENPEELSEAEYKEIISIIDIGPKHLDKVSPDNIRAVMERGVEIMRDERRRLKREMLSKYAKPTEAFREELSLPSSLCHAIQCAVNGAEDAKTFGGYFDKYSFEQKIGNEDENVARISAFLKRWVRDKKLLSRLYQVDIARRISLAKDDPQIFTVGRHLFEEIRIHVVRAVDEFESANREKLSKDEERALKELRQNLQKDDPEFMINLFYDEICQKFAVLNWKDFEGFNENELKRAIEVLESQNSAE